MQKLSSPLRLTQGSKPKRRCYWTFIGFVNRFIVKMKLVLVYVRPQRLKALALIDDKVNYLNVSTDERNFLLSKQIHDFQDEHPQLFDYLGRRWVKKYYRFMNQMSNFKQSSVRNLKENLNGLGNKIGCLDPASTLMIIWRTFSLMFQTFMITVIPMKVCFNIDTLSALVQWTFYHQIVEMLIQINCKVYVNGTQTSKRTKIIATYLKDDFVLDLICLIGLGLPGNWQVLFILKIFPLTKFVQRYKLELIQSQQLVAFIDLLIVFLRVLMIAHIFACLWYALGLQEMT